MRRQLWIGVLMAVAVTGCNSGSSTTTSTNSATSNTTPPTAAATTPAHSAQSAPAGTPGPIPHVIGLGLDQAESLLLSARIGYAVQGARPGELVSPSGWQVCDQNPAAGTRAASVILMVARICR